MESLRKFAHGHVQAYIAGHKTLESIVDTAREMLPLPAAYYIMTVASFLPDSHEVLLRQELSRNL